MMNKINEYSIMAYEKGRSLKNRVASIFKNEEGQGMVEYGLIIGLISVVVIALLATMGTELKEKFQAIITELQKDPQ